MSDAKRRIEEVLAANDGANECPVCSQPMPANRFEPWCTACEDRWDAEMHEGEPMKTIELHRRYEVDGVIERSAERVLVFPAQVAGVVELPEGGARVLLARSSHYLDVVESYEAVRTALAEAGVAVAPSI